MYDSNVMEAKANEGLSEIYQKHMWVACI